MAVRIRLRKFLTDPDRPARCIRNCAASAERDSDSVVTATVATMNHFADRSPRRWAAVNQATRITPNRANGRGDTISLVRWPSIDEADGVQAQPDHRCDPKRDRNRAEALARPPPAHRRADHQHPEEGGVDGDVLDALLGHAAPRERDDAPQHEQRQRPEPGAVGNAGSRVSVQADEHHDRYQGQRLDALAGRRPHVQALWYVVQRCRSSTTATTSTRPAGWRALATSSPVITSIAAMP